MIPAVYLYRGEERGIYPTISECKYIKKAEIEVTPDVQKYCEVALKETVDSGVIALCFLLGTVIGVWIILRSDF